MKRFLMLWLAVIVAGVTLADEVTQQQALQQAAAFVKQRAAAGHGHRAPGAPQPELKMAGRVDGLYLFNIDEQGGYVIVSNDDLTDAVLGYADSGSLDAANMPQNMRAWLQGYADEIAWAKAHSQQLRALQQLNAQAPRQQQRASAVKTAISPLLGDIEWNQNSPYNDMCPKYDTENHAATGCVATAMAQVMFQNYKRFKDTTPVASATTADIKHEQRKETIPAGTTLQWNLMQDAYEESESGTAAGNAVALLMKCCGYALQMSYGPQSGTQTNLVADALKKKFGFSSTTTYKPRSKYSYANWIEMIYNELSQQRAVVYAGSSAGGGHAFVCDGYDAEDYFHINWGWGGTSNGSFKLSALNPSSQGIGGSSSTDGYHYGQEAIVGIQPNGATGTVLEKPQNTINLALNSIAADLTNAAVGQTVTVTLNVTNNSTDDYDGDLYIYNYTGKAWLGGKTFKIAAGATVDCVLTFQPTAAGTYQIKAIAPDDYGSLDWLNYSKSTTVTVTGASSADLSLTTTVDNLTPIQYYQQYGIYAIAGTALNGTVTLTNPDTETTFSGQYQVALITWVTETEYEYVKVVTSQATIPAGGSIEVPFSISGLDLNTVYILYSGSAYDWNNDFISSTNKQFQTVPAVVTYDKNGNATVSTGTTYTATANDAFVNVAGTGVNSVNTTNANPNCLYVVGYGESVSGLDGANVVTKVGDTYTASSITLTDGNNFYSPEDIEVSGNITFTYTLPSTMADGTNGWSTVVLPFDVTQVTANGTAITWFTSNSDTNGRFWLKQFVSDDASNLYFGYVAAGQMKANTPYIVALPGSKWGSAYDLTGKEIKFIGTGTIHKSGSMMSVTGSNMRFVGSTTDTNTENIYALNNEGNRFVQKATGGSQAFRAYVKPSTFDASLASYSIRPADGSTTNISFATNGEVKREGLGFYNLQGQRVEHPRKGLYISGGRKVIVK